MSNELAKEKSLYLKQHAENPVNWWPWCDQAFDLAKKENKLVLISIGYSSCHWCHVMAHQCFEDPYIADIMNRHYICIKVDREERPDIDNIYMEAVQMLNKNGGWPLNVFCLPDGRPFFGGSYFPPKDTGQGLVPWAILLMRIHEHYQKQPQEFEENAESIVNNLDFSNTPPGSIEDFIQNEDFLSAAQTICQSHDDEWGGFGSAPKFPPAMILDFLLQIRLSNACSQNSKFAQRIDQVLTVTLKSIAHGGIYDQIGGGFARYSVDRFWIVPHFEKMLYDNALLIDIYAKAWLRYQNPLFQSIVEETIDWLINSMGLDSGLFAASIDADSEGSEGKFYVWTPDQVQEVLGAGYGKIFCEAYNITPKGNFENNTSNPCWVYDDPEKRHALQPMREKLLKSRQARVAPVRDSKALVSWNALAIRSLVQAAFTFGRRDWFEVALKGADFAWEHLVDENNRLKSIHYGDSSQGNATLDDYAFLAEAYLALSSKALWYESSLAETYLLRAKTLIDTILDHFNDNNSAGFFFTADDHESLITRKKIWWDNALPCGNASMVHCLSSLFVLTGESIYREHFQELSKAYRGICINAPTGLPHALSGFAAEALGIAQIKFKTPASAEALQQALSKVPARQTFLIAASPEQKSEFQLCIGSQCLLSTDSLEDLLEAY